MFIEFRMKVISYVFLEQLNVFKFSVELFYINILLLEHNINVLLISLINSDITSIYSYITLIVCSFSLQLVRATFIF